MATDTIIQAVKKRVWRGVKVLGLYFLWRSLGATLALGVLVGSAIGALKLLYDTPANDFFFLSTPVMNIQNYTYLFLSRHPYLWPVWNLIPVFDPKYPLTLLTSGWLVWIPVALVGGHLLQRKVKEDPLASSIIVHGDVGMVSTGTLAIRHIESIAAHLNRFSSPAEKRVVDAITEVTKAVTKDRALDDATRAEVLELLMALAQQTVSPPAGRSRGVARAIVRNLDTALNAAGNLADIWSVWGQTIKDFFGISG
jgi:hypothetical protein